MIIENAMLVKFKPFQHQNHHLSYFNKLHVYFRPTIVNGAKSLKAPSLNLSNDFPFDVVPYGNMISG